MSHPIRQMQNDRKQSKATATEYAFLIFALLFAAFAVAFAAGWIAPDASTPWGIVEAIAPELAARWS